MRDDGAVVRHRHALAPDATLPRRARPRRPRARPRRRVAAQAPDRRRRAASACAPPARSTAATYAERRARLRRRQAPVRKLRGARRVELAGSSRTLEGIAARGALTVSRLRAAVADARSATASGGRPARCCASGRARLASPAPSSSGSTSRARACSSTRSANFGKLNALWRSRADDDRMAQAARRAAAARRRARRRPRLGVLLRLRRRQRRRGSPASRRAPALQALARAATRSRPRRRRSSPIAAPRRSASSRRRPPAGVRVPRRRRAPTTRSTPSRPACGSSTASSSRSSGSTTSRASPATTARAARCSPTGERARARSEVPTYDTGAWSLYSRGSVTRESDLNYHALLRDFLDAPVRPHAREPVYCDTEAHFTALPERAARGRAASPARLRGGARGAAALQLSKISRVDAARHARRPARLRAHAARLGYGTARARAGRSPRRARDATTSTRHRDRPRGQHAPTSRTRRGARSRKKRAQ